MAAGTPANTPIRNSATLSYSIGGQPATPVTAVAPVILVGEVIDLVLTWQDGTPVPVGSPDIARTLTFLLTNAGNGPESFRLVRNDLVAGDQFDPAGTAPNPIYLESGAQPGFQASGPNADIPYRPGINDPLLPADTSRTVYLASNIPAAAPTGARGDVSLSASALTAGAAGAAAGTTLAAQGPGGTDAVVGASRARATATGGYIVSGIALNVDKTVVAVRDAQGGALVMPGAVLTYRIVLRLTGTGVAENLSFSDPLPANTTYLPGTVTVDGAARSDAADADNASFAAGTVSVQFGNTPVPATRVIEFKATVN